MPRIHHVNIIVPTGATDDVVAFYEDVLGLQRIQKTTGRASGAWLDVGDGSQIHLSERDGHGHPDSHFALAVEDLDGILERLKARNVAWTPQETLGSVRRGFFRDPAGNRVELMHYNGEE